MSLQYIQACHLKSPHAIAPHAIAHLGQPMRVNDRMPTDFFTDSPVYMPV